MTIISLESILDKHSLKRLGVDYIDLYQPARIDLGIPVKETICARKVNQLQESMKSLDVHLNESDVKRIEEAIPESEIAGGSFPQMKFKNGMVVQN
ncbi:hypothetical protein [Bacillus salipaludis]|uniref:Uncharacterized protein n=1 Tax=Bacillus salipaludis TaxID=2547811 RepID=A0AA90TQ95_9BACI|nr:hypothetical protein [Bacillus salipaludis]MDQ6597766.1 hypothetical protein [Bacillus salipaludis]